MVGIDAPFVITGMTDEVFGLKVIGIDVVGYTPGNAMAFPSLTLIRE